MASVMFCFFFPGNFRYNLSQGATKHILLLNIGLVLFFKREVEAIKEQ